MYLTVAFYQTNIKEEHCTLNSTLFTMYTLHYIHCKSYNVLFYFAKYPILSLQTVYFPLSSVQCVSSTVHIGHCTLYTVKSTICFIHSGHRSAQCTGDTAVTVFNQCSLCYLLYLRATHCLLPTVSVTALYTV